MRRVQAAPVVVAVLSTVFLGGSMVQAAAPRMDTTLPGYTIKGEAAPFRLYVDDPAIPIPRPLDAAIVEVDPAFTSTSLATGPTSQALSSALWPGNLIGAGFGQFAAGQTYPVQALASFPGGTPEATQALGGFTATSSAQGLDVVARAGVDEPPIPGLGLGAVQSASTSTVDDKNVAIGGASSQVGETSIAGLITVKAVKTVVEARSDGKSTSSSGTTTVAGLTIAGTELVVDDKGVRLAGQSAATPQTATVLDAIKALGITVEPPSQIETVANGVVTRKASGLRIVLDAKLVRGILDDSGLTGPLTDLLGALPDLPAIPMVPLQPGGLLFAALATSPKLTFELGAATASSAASTPFAVAPAPATPGTPSTPSTPSTPTVPGSPVLPGTSGPAPLPGLPTDPLHGVAAPPVDAPVLADPGASTVALGQTVSDYTGLSIALLIGALALSVVAGRFLQGLSAAALGSTALGCPLGAPQDVPDLRGA